MSDEIEAYDQFIGCIDRPTKPLLFEGSIAFGSGLFHLQMCIDARRGTSIEQFSIDE